MIPLNEAQALVIGSCEPLAPVEVPLADATDCVLAEDVVAVDAVPPFDNSAMDGFAVQAADVAGATESSPVQLDVIATIPAGRYFDGRVRKGQAARIMTGAPLPAGADSIVKVESTRPSPGDVAESRDGDSVLVTEAVSVGRHVRRSGDDIQQGATVFAPGAQLGPAHLGVLASVGRCEVRVHGRVRVGVLSTGDELVECGTPLAPGQIRDSNRLALIAELARSGFEAVDLGLVADEEQAVASAISDGIASCDALVTSGGVSMGDFDFVKVVLDRLGAMRWMQVAIKPAKPLAFGTVSSPDGRSVPVFGLPGNPVSSLVSFELFARPALRRMAGHADDDLARRPIVARAAEPFVRRSDNKIHFVRAIAEADARGGCEVRSSGSQGSHQLSSMAACNALVVLPDGPGAGEGDEVEVLLLRDPR